MRSKKSLHKISLKTLLKDYRKCTGRSLRFGIKRKAEDDDVEGEPPPKKKKSMFKRKSFLKGVGAAVLIGGSFLAAHHLATKTQKGQDMLPMYNNAVKSIPVAHKKVLQLESNLTRLENKLIKLEAESPDENEKIDKLKEKIKKAQEELEEAKKVQKEYVKKANEAREKIKKVDDKEAEKEAAARAEFGKRRRQRN
jgi:peptidoglycan hydrolase CwlO-like protein